MNVIPLRPGTRFVYKVEDGERYWPHPSGHGLIIVHPDKQPRWVRIDLDQVIISRISLPMRSAEVRVDITPTATTRAKGGVDGCDRSDYGSWDSKVSSP